jgi:hypothetical protein
VPAQGSGRDHRHGCERQGERDGQMPPRPFGTVRPRIDLFSCGAFNRHMPPTGLFCTVGAYMCSPGVLDVQRQIQFGRGTSQPQFQLADSGKVRRRFSRLINGGASFGKISRGKRVVRPDQAALGAPLSHADFEALPLRRGCVRARDRHGNRRTTFRHARRDAKAVL